jgi:ankyrin repeat protein
LLEKGADIKAKDVDDCTPLWYAVMKGHDAVVNLLLEKGADIEVKGDYGQTPLLLAVVPLCG